MISEGRSNKPQVSPLLPPLYPITDRALSGARSHFRLTLDLIAAGATWIQIREKQSPAAEILEQIERAAACAFDRGVTLLINDWVEIARATRVSGVHLGQTDAAVEEARRVLPRKVIGFSTHSLQQAKAAARLPVDYLSIGPVFPTQTKTENPPLGLEVVRQVRGAVSKPLVAIGGINLTNVAEVWASGVDSVAVISDIMAHSDITERAAAYLDLWKQIHA